MNIIIAIAISLITYSQPTNSYPKGTNLDHGVIR
jgi:hypothetical protein